MFRHPKGSIPEAPAAGKKDRSTVALVVEAALFEDYSFEGDVRKIISFLLEQRGFQLAIPPVLEMIERTLDGDRVDFETQASELYEAVGTMELTLDPVEIDAAAALLESWHSLPRAEVAQRLQSGYLLLRRSFLSELNVNTRRFLEQPNPGKLFWHWLEGLQQRYRKWLTDLNQIPQRLTNR